MNIFCCALQYRYMKFMLKVTKAWETSKNYNKKYCKIIITNTVEHVYIFSKKYCLFPPIQILISSLWCNVMSSLKLTLTYKAWATCAFTGSTLIKRVCHKICVIWIWTNWSKKRTLSLFWGIINSLYFLLLVSARRGNSYQCDVTVICVSTWYLFPWTHILGDMCFPSPERHILSDVCFPTWETHIHSDMWPRKDITLVICVPYLGNTYP